MRLSPITNYQLQRLFRQRSDRLQPLANGRIDDQPKLIDISFDAVLQNLCQQHSEIGGIVHKLEGLVSLHQALEQQGALYANEVASVEATIFYLLGFQILNDMSSITT